MIQKSILVDHVSKEETTLLQKEKGLSVGPSSNSLDQDNAKERKLETVV
jgi:hypothetical protein